MACNAVVSYRARAEGENKELTAIRAWLAYNNVHVEEREVEFLDLVKLTRGTGRVHIALNGEVFIGIESLVKYYVDKGLLYC